MNENRTESDWRAASPTQSDSRNWSPIVSQLAHLLRDFEDFYVIWHVLFPTKALKLQNFASVRKRFKNRVLSRRYCSFLSGVRSIEVYGSWQLAKTLVLLRHSSEVSVSVVSRYSAASSAYFCFQIMKKDPPEALDVAADRLRIAVSTYSRDL